MTVTRRATLGMALAAAATVAASCTRAARSTRTTGGSPPRSHPPTRAVTSAAGTSNAASPPSTSAPGAAGPAAQIAHGPRTRPEVALTFHGAGDPAIARDLLAVFAAHHAQVTVLAVGSWLAANPGIAGEIVAAGHELGNHTYHHLDIDSLDAATARTEIVRCRDLLVSQVGSPGAYFRQSQARLATPLVRSLAGAAGYRTCLSYDVDSLDYTDPGPDIVRAHTGAAQPGSIVSMHFGHRGTVQAMPAILGDLAARRLRPVGAGILLRP